MAFLITVISTNTAQSTKWLIKTNQLGFDAGRLFVSNGPAMRILGPSCPEMHHSQ